jgi:excinuclease UvrABC nuclease subunit
MLPITQLESLPKITGIYRVLDAKGAVVYVGQAKNIHKRWHQGHHKMAEIIARYGVEVYIDWTVVPSWLLNRAEHAAIAFYRPELNAKKPPVV